MKISIKKITVSLILITPLFFISLIFSSWNIEKIFNPDRYEASDKKKITFHIDKCILKDGATYVSGWAFIDAQPEKQKIIITTFRDGKYFQHKVLIKNRTDVSKVYNRGIKLDHSGFSFSYRLNNNIDKSFNINILSDGVLYSETYTCH